MRASKFSYPVVVLLMFTWAATLMGCPNQGASTASNTGVDMYVYIDKTDQHMFEKLRERSSILMNEILSKFPLQGGSGGLVHLILITDHGAPESYVLECPIIPSGVNKFSPPRSYLMFKSELKKRWDEIFSQPSQGYDRSAIYEPLCEGVNELDNSDYKNKIVILLSDMLEHGASSSMYNQSSLSESTVDRWAEFYGCDIPGLEEISFYIVNYRSRKTEQLIIQAKKFWSDIIKSKSPKKYYWGSSLHLE